MNTIRHGGADDNNTSQHCFDPFSLDHFTSAIFLYIVVPPGGPGQYCISESLTFGNPDGTTFPWQWFLINSLIHLSWEIIENTPCCIHYFRSSGVDTAYYGDSVVNTITDQLLNMFAYIVTWALVENVGWYMAPILFVIIQIVSCFMGAGFFMIIGLQFKLWFCSTANHDDDERGTSSVDELLEEQKSNQSDRVVGTEKENQPIQEIDEVLDAKIGKFALTESVHLQMAKEAERSLSIGLEVDSRALID